jgi:DNA-binding LacI/PurR family transcriptional regulator
MPGMRMTHVLAQLVDACTAALGDRGLSLVTDYAQYDDTDSQLAAWARLDAAVVLDLLVPHDAPIRAALAAAGIPILSASMPGEASWESTGDTFARAQRINQLQYLVDCGHRSIVFLLPPRTGPNRLDDTAVRQLRAEATKRGARLTVRRAALTREAMTAIAADWAKESLGDALAAFNDDYAIGIVSALSSAGIRVPEDVAVIGVDDMPLASVVTPSITTITVEWDEFAAALAESVAGLLSEGRAGPVQPLPAPPYRVVVRDSA